MLISKSGNIRINQNSKARKNSSKKSSTSGVTDRLSLSGLRRKLSRGLKNALLAATLATALAGPALAQTPPGTAALLTSVPQIEQVMTQPSDTTAKKHFNVEFNFVNDNGPAFMHRALGSSDNVIPGSNNYGDDDGWTSEHRVQTNFGQGNRETTVGARLMMLTETGSWNRNLPGSTYQGRRTDIGEFVVQRNTRTQLREGTTLELGVGGGAQAIGNLGGESIQRWWHESGPLGGRTGTALQGQYTSDGFRVMPLITGGAELVQEATPHLDFKVGAQTAIPLGSGVGRAGLRTSVETRLGPVQLEVGGKLEAGWSLAPETSFHDIDGIRPGGFGRLEVQAGKVGSVYTQVETGGFYGEPVLNVGLRIGLGGQTNLNPF